MVVWLPRREDFSSQTRDTALSQRRSSLLLLLA
jgi:hypothetical protein